MATATISVPSRTKSRRAVLGTLAVLIIALAMYAFTVGFGSDSTTTSVPVSATHSTSGDVLLDCRAGKPC